MFPRSRTLLPFTGTGQKAILLIALTEKVRNMSSGLGSRVKQWWLPALLVAGLGLFFASGAHRAVSWQTIALHYGQITAYAEANLAAAAGAFLLLYAVAVAFSLPIALPLTLTGGAIFGWLAVLLVLVGATAGAGVVFIAARTAFADLARGAPVRSWRGSRMASAATPFPICSHCA